MALNNLRKFWVVFSVAVFGVLLPSSPAPGWDQPTHRQINLEAIRLFQSRTAGKEKFRLGPFSKEGLSERLRGVAVASSSLLVSDFRSEEAEMSAQSWITSAGDWADEPHLYSSVRHFYDPLALSGVSYLTDQSEYHGLYDSPATDARTWGLTHPENPFNFSVALAAYKAALEVREDLPLPRAVSLAHFKTGLNLQPNDHEDQRKLHLSRAYRALGESMHMLGDMTQPAHVRNDSHPADEPVEAAIFPEHVRRAAAAPFIDPRIRPSLASAGGTLLPPSELFHAAASFVNGAFYSLDTIYDKDSGVLPNNAEIAAGVTPGSITMRGSFYPSPQIKDLAAERVKIQGFVGKREVRRFYGLFDSRRAAMMQDRLSFHWFDPDQSFMAGFEGALEKGGRAAAAGLGKLGPFQIPHAFAAEQGQILLPVAIHAAADLIDLFYPTLELSAEYDEEEVPPAEEEPSAVPARAIEILPSMKHLADKDPAWKEAGLSIEYSGPARLVIREKKEEILQRKVWFVKGRAALIEKKDGKMEKAPLKLFAAGSRGLSDEEELFYEIKPGQEAFIRIEAGSRVFESNPWKEKEKIEVSILPPRILVLELIDEASEAECGFGAAASREGAFTYEWDFGDGVLPVRDSPSPGGKSEQTCTYYGLKPGDSFRPTVRLFDEKGRFLSEDSISVTVVKGEKRHFFENRTYWLTASPLANDQNVQLPTVPLSLAPSISGMAGEIVPGSPEEKRMSQLVEGMAGAGDWMKQQMAAEMAKMGVSLSDPQMAEAMKMAMGMAGLDAPGGPMQNRPLLGSGWLKEGKPASIALSVSTGPIPPIEMTAVNQSGERERVLAKIAVKEWFLTAGGLTSPRVQGAGGQASVSWTPRRGEGVESYALDLVMFYSLELLKADGSGWKDGPVRYDNLSVTFPAGFYFCPVRDGKEGKE
ncbi:MAG: hypothetical protein ACOX5A_01545 [Aminivibrio sp.]